PGTPVPAGSATPGGAAAATSAVAGAQDPQSAAAAIIARRRAKSQEQHSAGSEPAPQPQTQTQPPAKTAQSSAEQQTPQQQQQPQVEPQPQSEPEPEPQESQDPWQRERRIPQSAPAQQERQEQREPLEKPVPARAEESDQEATARSGGQPAAETASERVSETAQPQATQEPEGDFAEAVREKWVALRGSVGKRNRVAEIMLAEARVLGFRDGTLTLGHTTGALAERINAPANNAVIVEVLKEEFQRDVAVTCVVGTDPKTAGFNAPRPAQRKEAWTPNQPAREPADDQEAESKQENTPGWRSRIARATQAAKQRDESQFSNGVPLPPEPEPEPDEVPPEEPPAYTRDDEERDMMEAAQSTGEMDHRSATEVAMELLERELGARRA
ncbi:MAG: DNA polymerase III subunit gamma/tau, partial [Corynebacterium sp.]|nr:DNA polymerase III subunit gamma/tau [Corynebacterium sp.]